MYSIGRYHGEWAVLAPNGCYVLFGPKKEMKRRAAELNLTH